MSTIASVLVYAGNDYREQARRDFDNRLDRLLALVSHLKNAQAGAIDAVLLPAGYLGVGTEAKVDGVAARIAAGIRPLGPEFLVVVGIDSRRDVTPKEVGYPFYLFGFGRDYATPYKIRQVSLKAPEGRDPIVLKRWGERCPLLPGTHFALLACGESRSTLLRERMRAAQPSALLIAAHQKVDLTTDRTHWRTMNYSWHVTLEDFNNETGIPAVLSEHTWKPMRHPHAWGTKKSEALELPSPLNDSFHVKLAEV